MALHEPTTGRCTRALRPLTAKFLDLGQRRLPFVSKPEVIFDRINAIDQAGANDERSLNPEYRITSQIFVPVKEEMRNKGAISRRTNHEVNMCRPERVAPHCREQLAGRTIIRNRIAYGHDGSESEGAGGVAAKAAPQMTVRLIFVLNIVELIGRGLPDLQKRICDRPALGVRNAATHLQRITLLFPQKNALACSKLSLLSGIERAQDRRFAESRSPSVIDGVNQHRNP